MRALDVAGHLRCVADDYHDYLDDAPASRLARLMATGVPAESLAGKLARQRNAAELAALPDVSGQPEHIAAFAGVGTLLRLHRPPLDVGPADLDGTEASKSALARWRRRASAEWHLHAWDLAKSLGKDYRPANPELVFAWLRAAMPSFGRCSPDRWRAATHGPRCWNCPAATPAGPGC